MECNYYLGGYSSSQCPPDQGNLPLVQGSSLIVSQSSRLYLAFQLDIAQPQTKLVYAVGPSNTFPSSGGYLAQHKSMASGSLTSPATGGGGDGDGDRDEDEGGERDRPSGRKHGDDESSGGDATATAAAASGGGLSLAKSHALLTIIGWGILLPAGIAMARFMKHYDPSWFYLHTSTQGIGFVAGIVGVIAGFKLERDLGEYGAHKALGVVVLALGCVQVTAILARPKEKSKARKYWNWYHHCVGRAAVVGATANVFYGLWLAKEAKDWSYAYGVFVGVWVTAWFVLEEWRKKHVVECALCC
ncbi:cytochrome b561 and DOMON domain-containing protein [Canna indica]|uniref:Cytochrome b561 and DOMON domain-containing protein n=1 Tax=Canna indica TaxID=4628 RepID=A0AAQ3KUX3_9LILI|nr:cytochrome b561 and DOMON domain-containing protein [Canna indica]